MTHVWKSDVIIQFSDIANLYQQKTGYLSWSVSTCGSTNKKYSCNKLFAVETEKWFLELLIA